MLCFSIHSLLHTSIKLSYTWRLFSYPICASVIIAIFNEQFRTISIIQGNAQKDQVSQTDHTIGVEITEEMTHTSYALTIIAD